ncbi:hypothetical protein ABID56_002344 [Alkalibacillus flavidus]|uniref:Uncharacterized protein n=1 Tax=Alkalibacillus flavidus TaxID=546021 RepID=A0ABV2KX94_9BACI
MNVQRLDQGFEFLIQAILRLNQGIMRLIQVWQILSQRLVGVLRLRVESSFCDFESS